MDGVIIVNKPDGYTSRDVVNVISKTLKTKKVGHTGTLDPMATGVLVVCVGRATKLVELLTSKEKEYIAEITLGLKTDTLDITGNILEEKEVNIDEETIDRTLQKLIGSYEQEVPIYSAVKINGKKLYEYARNNEEIELPKRMVEIKKLERISETKYIEGKIVFKIKTLVSKGTYIRSLVNDIALSLNTIGVMSKLERTKQGQFTIDDSYSIEQIQNGEYKLLSIEEALKDIKTIVLEDDIAFKVKNGVSIPNTYNEKLVLFKDKENKLISLYKDEEGLLKSYKYFG